MYRARVTWRLPIFILQKRFVLERRKVNIDFNNFPIVKNGARSTYYEPSFQAPIASVVFVIIFHSILPRNESLTFATYCYEWQLTDVFALGMGILYCDKWNCFYFSFAIILAVQLICLTKVSSRGLVQNNGLGLFFFVICQVMELSIRGWVIVTNRPFICPY